MPLLKWFPLELGIDEWVKKLELWGYQIKIDLAVQTQHRRVTDIWAFRETHDYSKDCAYA